MSNVTAANENILINFSAAAAERKSSVLQYRTGHAVARHVETRRCDIVQRRRDSRPEKRKSHFREIPAGGSGEQVRLTITTAEGKELIAAETRIK